MRAQRDVKYLKKPSKWAKTNRYLRARRIVIFRDQYGTVRAKGFTASWVGQEALHTFGTVSTKTCATVVSILTQSKGGRKMGSPMLAPQQKTLEDPLAH